MIDEKIFDKEDKEFYELLDFMISYFEELKGKNKAYIMPCEWLIKSYKDIKSGINQCAIFRQVIKKENKGEEDYIETMTKMREHMKREFDTVFLFKGHLLAK